MWNDFITLGGHLIPQDYKLRFPPLLISELAHFIYEECQKLKLVPYTNQNSNPNEFNITLLLNTAWKEFNNSPLSFTQWESEQLSEIKNYFNFAT